MDNFDKITNKTDALSLGSLDKRKFIKHLLSTGQLDDKDVREVQSKGYAYLNVSQSDFLIEYFFDGSKANPLPEPQKQKPAKAAKPKAAENGKQDFSEFGQMFAKMMAQFSPVDEEKVYKIVDDAVAKRIGQTVRVKAEIQDVETPEIESSNPDFPYMVSDLQAGNNVWLTGPTGTGKTVLAKELAKAMGCKDNDIHVVSCEPFTFRGDFWGTFKSANGDYRKGAFERAVDALENDRQTAVILDEITKLDPEIAGTLNAALASDKDGKRYFINGQGERKEITDVQVIATSNTFGKGFSSTYVGNQQQDASLLNRFASAVYYVDYNKQLEKSIVSEPVFKRLDAIREKLLKYELQHTISLRDMINVDRALQCGKPLERSVQSLTLSWTDEEKKKCGV